MTFDFRSLVLSEVDISRSDTNILKPGRYVCKVTDAKVDAKDGKYSLVVQLQDTASDGQIRAYLTLHNPNSAKATEVGQKQLKQLAVFGGHKDPNNAPSHGVDSFKGLVAGVCVAENTYNGKTRSQVSYFFDPKELGVESAEFGDFTSDIPF